MKTFANGRSIIHKGDNLTHTAAPPDVCKTPSPGGPVPIPYVNVAMDSSLASGTKKVKVEGKMAAHEKANISTSMGDEPGNAGGGLISSKFKGKLTWATSSPNVKLEGKGAVRFMDVTQHNGNSFNSAFIALGSPGLAYADDFEGKCLVCNKGPATHRVLSKKSSIDICIAIIEDLVAEFNSLVAKKTSKNQMKKQIATPKRIKERPEDVAEGAERRVLADGYQGYMIGVMICKGCDQSHAAMSGPTKSKFTEVAGKHADNVISGGAVSADDIWEANKSVAKNQPGARAAFDEHFDDLADRYDSSPPGSGWNKPGNCAGAKLVACGHAAAELTEMYFMPPNQPSVLQWSGSYEVLTTERTQEQLQGYSPSWKRKIMQNKAAKRTSHSFTGSSEGVASCHTCQELLYMATCDIDDWSC